MRLRCDRFRAHASYIWSSATLLWRLRRCLARPGVAAKQRAERVAEVFACGAALEEVVDLAKVAGDEVEGAERLRREEGGGGPGGLGEKEEASSRQAVCACGDHDEHRKEKIGE